MLKTVHQDQFRHSFCRRSFFLFSELYCELYTNRQMNKTKRQCHHISYQISFLPSPVTVMLAWVWILPKWLEASQTYSVSSSTHRSDMGKKCWNPNNGLHMRPVNVKLTGDMKTSLVLSHDATSVVLIEKGQTVQSPPGDLWIWIALGLAWQGHIGTDVHRHV